LTIEQKSEFHQSDKLSMLALSAERL